MKIACLGWGSLIWNPDGLPCLGDWGADGPYLPIEFTRESSDRRITLVLTPEVEDVRSLWTLLGVTSANDAVEALARREKCPVSRIGLWTPASDDGSDSEMRIGRWARDQSFDGVVWTALGPGFQSSPGTVPSVEEVLSHLRSLTGTERDRAEAYVRKAPAQINTTYRGHIQAELDWLSVDG